MDASVEKNANRATFVNQLAAHRHLPATAALTNNRLLFRSKPHCDVTDTWQTNEDRRLTGYKVDFFLPESRPSDRGDVFPTSSNGGAAHFARNSHFRAQEHAKGGSPKVQILEDSSHEPLCGCCFRALALRTYKRVVTSTQSLGKQIRRRRNSRSFSVNQRRNAESGLYLGSVTTILAKGEGCTDIAVSKVLEHSKDGRVGVPVTIAVKDRTLQLRCDQMVIANGGKDDFSVDFELQLRRITTCAVAASSALMLAWVYRHEVKHKRVVLRCHVIKLPTSVKTRNMVADINRARQMCNNAHKRSRPYVHRNRVVAKNAAFSFGPNVPNARELFVIPESIERDKAIGV